MSKFWLLLLFVAALQFAHSYPAAEYEVDLYTNDEDDEYMIDESDNYMSDEEETRGSVIKDTFNKLRDKYKEIGTKGAKNIIAILKDRYCGQEFEEDYQSDEAEDKVNAQYNIVQTLKGLYEKAKSKWGQEKDKLKEALAILRQKFCAELTEVPQESDVYEDEGEAEGEVDGDDGDEERLKFKPGKVIGKLAKGAKSVFKKVGLGAKLAMKKGLTVLQKMGVTISPLQCEEKTCKSCATLKIPQENTFCVSIKFLKTNVATYLVIAGEMNQTPKFEKKIKLGDVPTCMNVGGPLGKICLKSIEGHAKSISGQANVNFCLGVLIEKISVGCKFCVIYENKKLKVKVKPKIFAGTTSDDGDIVQLDQNGEDAKTLDAEEFEVD